MDHRMDAQTAAAGAIGVVSTLSSFLISISNIETSLRIASLLVGLAVGITTLVKLYAPTKKQKRRNHDL